MHNLDPTEVLKFEKMANNWWNPTGECRPLHDLNPARLQFISDRCRLISKKILDVGCGGGLLSESMSKRGGLVTGIDATLALINVAKLHAAKSDLKGLLYEHCTAEDYAEQHAGEFDVITCMELLEHVPDPASLISACAKLAKPNAHLFFSTLNRTPKAYFLAILGAEYVLRLLPRGTHEYQKFIRPSELGTALRKSGLTLKELSGLHYNPITRVVRLNQDVSVNYLAYATFNEGKQVL